MVKNIFSFITTPQTSVCAYPCMGKRNMNLSFFKAFNESRLCEKIVLSENLGNLEKNTFHVLKSFYFRFLI